MVQQMDVGKEAAKLHNETLDLQNRRPQKVAGSESDQILQSIDLSEYARSQFESICHQHYLRLSHRRVE